ncbi:TolC family outer membrane protein [Vagococcus sp. WN89Y]|uniref:TolC family outer membrane protein n=1 Tax=Vagococcus sp. WN89Y TaxID=3457258 RepID=UPI003FCDF7AD
MMVFKDVKHIGACLLIASFLSSINSPGYAASGYNSLSNLTLKESILRAFARNPEIAQKAAQMGISQAQIDEAKSGWYPQIALMGNAGPSRQYDSSGSLDNSASYGITLSQLVYDFGKTSNTIKEQGAIHERDRFELMATLADVAEKTALAFIEVNRYQTLSEAARKNIDALGIVRRLAKLRADSGLNSTSDELQAQTRIAGMRANYQEYQAQQQSAKAQLAVLNGVQPASLAPLPQELAEQPTALDNIDYANVPAVQAAEYTRLSADYGVQSSKAEHWPTLSLKGGKIRNQTRDRSYWNDQLQLNVEAPIYQGGAVSARVQQAEGKRQVSATLIEQAKLDVLQKASVAFAEWQGARSREKVNAEQAVSALQTRKIYQGEYQLSTRSLNDLLSAEQDVFQAQSAEINAKFDGWRAAVNYASSVNNLIPLLGISSGVYGDLPELH